MVLLPFFLLQAVIAGCQRLSSLLVTNLGKEQILKYINTESRKATVFLQDKTDRLLVHE